MTTRIPGFTTRRLTVNGTDLHFATGGKGPPLLLLHGFPQTHLTWRSVAPALAESHTVICPDLPGYGDSGPPNAAHDSDPPSPPFSDSGPSTAGVEHYSKRAMATTFAELMTTLGHQRFAVAGHDRGGLVAFRLALDHADRVTHTAVLDVLPAVDIFGALAGAGGVFAFHLYFLAHPEPLPERMIAADPAAFFGHFLDTWTKVPGALPEAIRSEYLQALKEPSVIHAICQDYRAGVFFDLEHDKEDKAHGRRLSMPVLAMWQDPGEAPLPFDPAAIWQSWAPTLTTKALPCGHFLPEERPEEVITALRSLLG
ncbi:alpha/beta fold hydrolase [Amycolatopsis sp. 195334CR]|uniref:alpha/beta fold hydrolase n=1 Tax=Amycolatopsis sp. 195334CR TaxID=2814588 RepID=UPI001A8D75F9|nr:alpha/beta hydrolase [Amycolatopsis sp. 195334CR]MBN6041587.1 alpha/beta hydrolase [Amycolatopsis sp. 195334CR]